jgi:DNA-binding winged helix-turn-helix (wHTH) protein/tetratricopeptide (TPR) repeat protein
LQQVAFATGPVDLARARAFALGPLKVTPATRQVAHGPLHETLEPRVMQVLVALAEAQGDVVTRDTLIERCWDGVVVGEGAINRVIARLRRLGEALGGAFRIETITKVGYRLLVDPAPDLLGDQALDTELDRPQAQAVPSAQRPTDPPGTAVPPAPVDAVPPLPHSIAVPISAAHTSRRGLVAGAVALVAAAGAGGWWWATRGPGAPPSVTDAVVARADVALHSAFYAEWMNVVASLRQVVADDPGHAGAWGSLALAEARWARNNPPEAIPTAMARAREAAARALAIDPDNANAQAALAMLVPQSRRWEVAEAAFARVLARHPDHLWANQDLGLLLLSVGRVREALVQSERVVAIDPGYFLGASARAERLWGTGQLREAERAFDSLGMQWPGNRMGWLARFSFLALTGRAEQALALSRAAIVYPGETTALVDLSVQSVEAMASRDAALRSGAVEAHLQARSSGAYPSRHAAAFLLALGRPDLALLFLERVVLGPALTRGDPPKSALSDPFTEVLFWPPFAPLARQPRFRAILQRSGLEDYWARTGIVPDFRR